MARLQTCCCGCTLELGCRILAVLGLIGSALQAISSLARISLVTSDEANKDALAYIIIMSVAGGIFNIVINGLLLYGTNTHRKGFLLPWIIITILEIVVLVIGALVCIIITEAATIGVVFFFILLAAAALSSYFVAVVISFYQELSEGGGGYVAEPLRIADKC